MSWDGRTPCSDAWGYNGEHTNKPWKERGDRLKDDLAEWEELGGPREQWFADRGLGAVGGKDPKARWYDDTYG